MNTVPAVAIWLQLLGLLAAETAFVVGASVLFLGFTKSAWWRRTVWQVCLLTLLFLTTVELTGTGRNALGRFAAKSRSANRSTPTVAVSRAAEREVPVRLNKGSGDKVAGRVGQGTQRESAETTGAPATVIQTPNADPQTARRPRTAQDFIKHSSREDFSDALGVLSLGLIWLTGAGLVIVRSCLAHALSVLFRRRRQTVRNEALQYRVATLARRLGIHRRVLVVEAARLNGPIVFGVLRPTVGLPGDFENRFSPAQQEAMLAHELAHLASHDPGWHLVANLAVAILWWHPMVWWARYQLHAASEQAADEASLLVADGPRVLAECLVELGVRLTRPPSFVSLGVEGNGFRSGLGRRVERLLTLRGRSWRPPNRTRSFVIKAFGPGILVVAVILSTAWASPQAFIKGESMKTMKQTWKQSVAAVALLTSLGADSSLVAPTVNADDLPIRATPPPEETKPTTADGKPAATSTGKPTAEESPQQILNPYSRDLFRQRYGLIPGGAPLSENTLPDKKNLGPIASKLDQIVLNEVMFNDVPLPEVLKFLDDESRKRDPEKRGLNFLINPNVAPTAAATAVDPTTGQPVQLPAAEPLDMNSVVVRINLPLRDVRLKDVLDAIVKVADKPIEYSIEEYGVVFSQKTNQSTGGVEGQPVRVFDSPPLQVRTFKVDTNALLAGLERTFGIGIEATENPRATQIRAALRDVFSKLGINMDVSGKTVFYNDLTGIVMVRATADDLEIVKAAIETLGGAVSDSTASQSSGLDGPAPYPALREEMMRRYGLLPAKK